MNIDDDLMDKARKITGLKEKTAIVREGLLSLIQREAARRLIALGGSDKRAKAPPRRRGPKP